MVAKYLLTLLFVVHLVAVIVLLWLIVMDATAIYKQNCHCYMYFTYSVFLACDTDTRSVDTEIVFCV